MKRFPGPWILPLFLIASLGMAVLVDFQLHSVPMIRHDPLHPVYGVSGVDDALALNQGKQPVKLGPWLFGLYPGALAFASPGEARDYLQARGLSPLKWRIYLLSGDYQLDTNEGVLNKSLCLVRSMPD